MNNRNKALGLILIFLGFIFLLDNLHIISFNFLQIWPVLIILGGIGFWLGFFVNKKNISLIMPATILTIYGFLFFYCNWFGWHYMHSLWPVFLMGPGIGFYLLYLLGSKEKGLIVPATILNVLGLLFLLRHLEYIKYWPVLLIIGGIIIIFLREKDSAI